MSLNNLFIIFLLSFTIISSACSTKDYESEVSKTFKLIHKEKFAEALVKFNELEPKLKNNINLLTGQIMALNALGSLKLAEKKAQKAILLAPDNFYVQHNLGLIQLRLGKSALAIKSFNNALKIKPNWIEPLWNRGTAYDELSQWDKAINDYDIALIIQPENVNILSNRGFTKLKMQDYKGAMEDICKALSLDPGHPQAISNLSSLNEKIVPSSLNFKTNCKNEY